MQLHIMHLIIVRHLVLLYRILTFVVNLYLSFIDIVLLEIINYSFGKKMIKIEKNQVKKSHIVRCS